MVDVNKLMGKIAENKLSISKLAEKMNVDKSTMYRRFGNEGEQFTIKEADFIAKELHLSKDEAIAIFFKQYVAPCAT